MILTNPPGSVRGRPRSERARQAILQAAGELMLEGGMAAATMEAIAARAEVSKATIYKWWPSRGAVALDGFLARTADSITIPEGAGTVEALEYQVSALVRMFRDTASGPLMRALTAQAVSDKELARALRERWFAPRRAVTIDILRRGVLNGEVRADVDLEAAADQLFAPVYHRLNYAHGELSDDLPAVLVRQLLLGIHS